VEPFIPAMSASSQRFSSPASHSIQQHRCEIRRRDDGAVVVRVRSAADGDATLPDAVFAFRQGDPQFQYWDEQLRRTEQYSG